MSVDAVRTALGERRCHKPSCGQVIERIDGVVAARGGHTFYAVPCGHAQDQRSARDAYERGTPPVFLEEVTGVALVAAERRRQVVEEGATEQSDAELEAGELSWAAFCYLDRIAAQDIAVALDPAPPAMWPWAPQRWKPGPTRVRMLVKAGALIAAEVDRRLARGEQP